MFCDVFGKDHFDTSWAGSILLYTTALTSMLYLITSDYYIDVYVKQVLIACVRIKNGVY